MCVDSWFLNSSDAEVGTGNGHFLPEQPHDF